VNTVVTESVGAPDRIDLRRTDFLSNLNLRLTARDRRAV